MHAFAFWCQDIIVIVIAGSWDIPYISSLYKTCMDEGSISLIAQILCYYTALHMC